jgi:hypothetical protein
VILRPDKSTLAQAGEMIQKSLPLLYAEVRFWGRFEHHDGRLAYLDEHEGDLSSFRGKEQISAGGEVVSEPVYLGDTSWRMNIASIMFDLNIWRTS